MWLHQLCDVSMQLWLLPLSHHPAGTLPRIKGREVTAVRSLRSYYLNHKDQCAVYSEYDRPHLSGGKAKSR